MVDDESQHTYNLAEIARDTAFHGRFPNDVHDFLQRLVALLPPHGRLVVCPLGIGGEGLAPQDLKVWQLSLQSLDHPQILLAD